MADVSSDPVPDTGARPAGRKAVEAALSGGGAGDVLLIELLFFAYRDFTADPDAILEEFGFGRAHHRVLHFVCREPGLRVTDLLDILQITKQSLARVLRQLIEQGYIVQRAGEHDRRERLLFPTESGAALFAKLIEPQLRRVTRALAAAGPEGAETIEQFLQDMIKFDNRAHVRNVLGRAAGGSERTKDHDDFEN